MGYVTFISSLFEDGRLALPKFGPLTDEELRGGDELITEYEQVLRAELPGHPPSVVHSAARWAAINLFRACQFTVYRELGEDLLNQVLTIPLQIDAGPASVRPTTKEPGSGSGISATLINQPASAGIHYSVDMFFRYLPDLTKFAASAAQQDPLLEHLNRWSRTWPLSSVGMTGVGDVNIDGFAACPSLLQLYADRIMAAGDETRLSDDRVRQAVSASLGMYPELSEKISARLKA